MGQHALSMRLRIYLLLAIPLLTVVGLYAFVVTTTVGDALNLDRAPSLINTTSVPTAVFNTHVQDERRASLVYLADPTARNRAQLTAAQDATIKALPTLRAKLTSSATTGNATTREAGAIHTLLADAASLARVRTAVRARTISPAGAFGAFNAVIADELRLFLAEDASLTNAQAATQALATIDTVQAREFLLREDTLVAAAFAARTLTPAARAEITQFAGARRSAYANALADFNAADLAAFKGPVNKYAPPAVLKNLTTLENAVAADHQATLPFKASQWDNVATAVSNGFFAGGVSTAEAQVHHDSAITNAAWLRVALAGGLGLIGLIASVVVSGLVGRRLIRRLNRLGQSALTLAHQQLPDVVARLRRGEAVDEAQALPPMQSGNDEIGQVGEAFEAARRTAIQAAIDEAELRHGVNQVFRNLARRSQSLLHRQLALLDTMERRANDPEVLDDLFRLDHLTTRMRRHAEGLIILSGAPPGRGWAHPVRIVDVLRGAAAEVEDYARVVVTCSSPATLVGSVVADVIHLLAELIENATTLSPPYTSVRVNGELAAKGFVVEIEDRGLGMSDSRLAELNARLADPPEFNVPNSEQLGLFVVSHLAKRHGIGVTLRPSPYGGITAITLVPADLVVLGEEFAGGLPAAPSRAADMTRSLVGGEEAVVGDEPPGRVLRAGYERNALASAPQDGVPPDADIVVSSTGPFDAPSHTRRAGSAGIPPVDPTGPHGTHHPGDEGTYRGLPRRVRQASLAPQLRDIQPAEASPPGESGYPGQPTEPWSTGDTGPSPDDIRATMSAMQRGWEKGRAPWGPAPPPASHSHAPDGPAGREAGAGTGQLGGEDGA